MADRKKLGRSVSTESTEHSITMGKSVLKEKKHKKPKERWLLTRKTWRYMADAGKKLIPDGAHNRPEDVPKIEAYFQEICKREPKFLLWRKNSYPGALGVRRKLKSRRKSGPCRKAASVSEVDSLKTEHSSETSKPSSPPSGLPTITSNRLKIQQMKENFLNDTQTNQSSSGYSRQESIDEAAQERQLLHMLEQYLSISEKPHNSSSSQQMTDPNFNYQELISRLQQHLSSINHISYYPSVSSNPSSGHPSPSSSTSHIHFQGDPVQKSLYETLSRYFSHSPNREKIISDLLTDRRTLEKLYFELRKTKGFRGSRGGTGYQHDPNSYSSQINRDVHYGNLGGSRLHLPLIEVDGRAVETTYSQRGVQTLPIPEEALAKIEAEYKKSQLEGKEEQRKDVKAYPRRRSSVDHDDVSQSVSDTIKRYLRMARKKSVDSGKGDKFKRVNYDQNLRNIKAKGEITKPGDDDGLNKGCQTNDDWILTYRALKFIECYDVSDGESRISSSRSSIDVGVDDLHSPTQSPPPTKSSSHSFLSHLLHSKHDKHDKHDKSNSAATSSATAAMQKSKSSSNVIHQGGRLMAKTIFRSRSKSQQRPSQVACSWTPQGDCVWTNVNGKQIILNDTTLLQLSEIERKILQKVAIAKLQALNLGVAVKIPSENVGTAVKPKKRPYLLKKKALTTSIFDTSRKDGDKDGGSVSGLVFGIPLTQCIENDKLTRAASGTNSFRSPADHNASAPGSTESSPIARHGSRSSFTSLIDAPRGDERGSCESLLSRNRVVGSVPGLLDEMSCDSAPDIRQTIVNEECSVPNILIECFRHIEQYGLRTLGIFRVSTSKKRIRELRESFDCGRETTLEDDQCPHDVATLLKEYLRELPDPLLCRELYHAFVQTQRIRNRRLQFEALQHLIQLLPATNRDTLYALLNFLENVAKNSDDTRAPSGEILTGNKMDSNNLATVFAPNLLRHSKPGSTKDPSSERSEDRIDLINVVRILIDHYRQLFTVPAELLHEVYLYMMDSHPETLDLLLNRKDAIQTADESVDEVDSESYSATWSPTGQCEMTPDHHSQTTQQSEPRRTWSREEFLHEAAATGGPDMGMRIRHKDRIKERARRRRDASTLRKKKEEENAPSGISLLSRLTGKTEEDHHYTKNRSSSLESSSSIITEPDVHKMPRMVQDDSERRQSSPYVLEKSGVIKASLTIPVHTTTQNLSLNVDDDIPYIEDGDTGRQQLTIGLVRAPSIPPRRRQRSISGSDSSGGSSSLQPITASVSLYQETDSAVGSSAPYSCVVQNTTPASMTSSLGGNSSPPSWTSTPPTSPDSASANYGLDHSASTSKITLKKHVGIKEPSLLQKLSFMSNQDSNQQMKTVKDSTLMNRREAAKQQKAVAPSNIQKSMSASTFTDGAIAKSRDPALNPSISSIGNAVLKSRTAEFEKMTKGDEGTKNTTTTVTAEKKKYTKRRYTDSRHQTKPLPDLEALENTNGSHKDENPAVPQVTPVYKRKELISSVHSKQS